MKSVAAEYVAKYISMTGENDPIDVLSKLDEFASFVPLNTLEGILSNMPPNMTDVRQM